MALVCGPDDISENRHLWPPGSLFPRLLGYTVAKEQKTPTAASQNSGMLPQIQEET